VCTQYSWYIVGFHRFYTPIFGQMHLDTAQLGYSRTGWSTTKIKPKSAVPWVSIRLSTTSNYYIHDGKSHYISGWDINGILHDISVVSGIVMGHPPLCIPTSLMVKNEVQHSHRVGRGDPKSRRWSGTAWHSTKLTDQSLACVKLKKLGISWE